MKRFIKALSIIIAAAICFSAVSSFAPRVPQTVEAKAKFNAKAAKKAMSMKKFRANGHIYVEIKSSYAIPTDIDAKCTFYKGNKAVDYDSDGVSFLEKGHIYVMDFMVTDKDFDKYKIKYEYTEGLKWFYHSSVIKKIKLSTNYVEDEYYSYIMLNVKNNAKKECSYCGIGTYFYDENDQIIAFKSETISSISPKDEDTKKLYIPYIQNDYSDIQFDHYKSFIMYAYHQGR